MGYGRPRGAGMQPVDTRRERESRSTSARRALAYGRSGAWLGAGGVVTVVATLFVTGGPGGTSAAALGLGVLLALSGTALGVVAITVATGGRRGRQPGSGPTTGLGMGIIAALSWLWWLLAFYCSLIVLVASGT